MSIRRSALALALPAILAFAVAAVPFVVQGTSYHVVKEIPIGGGTGFDYLAVDTANNRLYVSNSARVAIVDLKRDTLIGEIPNTPGVHGMAFAPEFNRGYTSNGRDTTSTIFDLKTMAVIGTVKVTGANPDAITYDAATKRVFTSNHTGGNVTAIDAATGKVVGTVEIGGTLEAIVGDGTGRIFVNVEDRNEVVVFDGRTMTVQARWPIAPCESPTGLAIDVAHGRLFPGCSGTSVAIDIKTGKIVASFPVGAGVDAAAFEVSSQLLFVSGGGGAGTMTIVHEDGPDRYTVAQTAPTMARGRTMALDPKTHRVFVPFVKAAAGAAGAAAAAAAAGGGGGRGRGPAGTFTILVLEPGKMRS